MKTTLMNDDIREMINQVKSFNPSKDEIFIYHGTGKGQTQNIQRDGYMKPHNTGEEHESISFTNDLNRAKSYAIMKVGVDKMVVLRTKLGKNFKLSPRIKNNKGDEYITYNKIPSSDLDILTRHNGWQPLIKWDPIFDEPL